MDFHKHIVGRALSAGVIDRKSALFRNALCEFTLRQLITIRQARARVSTSNTSIIPTSTATVDPTLQRALLEQALGSTTGPASFGTALAVLQSAPTMFPDVRSSMTAWPSDLSVTDSALVDVPPATVDEALIRSPVDAPGVAAASDVMMDSQVDYARGSKSVLRPSLEASSSMDSHKATAERFKRLKRLKESVFDQAVIADPVSDAAAASRVNGSTSGATVRTARAPVSAKPDQHSTSEQCDMDVDTNTGGGGFFPSGNACPSSLKHGSTMSDSTSASLMPPRSTTRVSDQSPSSARGEVPVIGSKASIEILDGSDDEIDWLDPSTPVTPAARYGLPVAAHLERVPNSMDTHIDLTGEDTYRVPDETLALELAACDELTRTAPSVTTVRETGEALRAADLARSSSQLQSQQSRLQAATERIDAFVSRLRGLPWYRGQIEHVEVIPRRPPVYASPRVQLLPHTLRAIRSIGM